MPKMIGSINCYVLSHAWVGRKVFTFDGTTKGLAITLSKAGIAPGTKIKVNYGGRDKSSAVTKVVISAPHDDRANGIWIS